MNVLTHSQAEFAWFRAVRVPRAGESPARRRGPVPVTRPVPARCRGTESDPLEPDPSGVDGLVLLARDLDEDDRLATDGHVEHGLGAAAGLPLQHLLGGAQDAA